MAMAVWSEQAVAAQPAYRDFRPGMSIDQLKALQEKVCRDGKFSRETSKNHSFTASRYRDCYSDKHISRVLISYKAGRAETIQLQIDLPLGKVVAQYTKKYGDKYTWVRNEHIAIYLFNNATVRVQRGKGWKSTQVILLDENMKGLERTRQKIRQAVKSRGKRSPAE